MSLQRLEFDAEGQLCRHPAQVVHASRPEHIISLAGWFAQRQKRNVVNGIELWRSRASLLPSLLFCESTYAQLSDLRSGNPMLAAVLKKLFELEDYCRGWASGGFDSDRLPGRVSPESRPTLQKYGADREFLCPDGQVRLFSWHLRLTPGAWRMYLWPDERNRRIIIGYIGRKLPTVDYPT